MRGEQLLVPCGTVRRRRDSVGHRLGVVWLGFVASDRVVCGCGESVEVAACSHRLGVVSGPRVAVFGSEHLHGRRVITVVAEQAAVDEDGTVEFVDDDVGGFDIVMKECDATRLTAGMQMVDRCRDLCDPTQSCGEGAISSFDSGGEASAVDPVHQQEIAGLARIRETGPRSGFMYVPPAENAVVFHQMRMCDAFK